MWYEWEWQQWSAEEILTKNSGDQRFRWKTLVRAAWGYLRVGKPQKDDATRCDAIQLASKWVRSEQFS